MLVTPESRCLQMLLAALHDLGRGSLYLLQTNTTPLPFHEAFLPSALFSSGLWALLSLAISSGPSHSFPCVLQTGRPGSIISRARIWQPSLKAKHKLCRGLMMLLRGGTCSFPPTSGHPSIRLMSRSPVSNLLPSHFCTHPQRVPPVGSRWSLFSSPRYYQRVGASSPRIYFQICTRPPGSKTPIPHVHPQKVRECQPGP